MAVSELVPATVRHAEALACVMREEDVVEVYASDALSPIDAALQSLERSEEAVTLLVDGEVAAMWGLCSKDMPAGIACIWLFTGEAVTKHPRHFLEKFDMRPFLARYPVLLNAIDARHKKALRWAGWLGCEILPAIPYGRHGLPFHPVVLTVKACASSSRPLSRQESQRRPPSHPSQQQA